LLGQLTSPMLLLFGRARRVGCAAHVAQN